MTPEQFAAEIVAALLVEYPTLDELWVDPEQPQQVVLQVVNEFIQYALNNAEE